MKVPLFELVQADSNSIYTAFPLSWLKKFPGLFQDFPRPQKNFPGPCHMPVMFKYRDKQQLLVY